jgi:hypothetical protein
MPIEDADDNLCHELMATGNISSGQSVNTLGTYEIS